MQRGHHRSGRRIGAEHASRADARCGELPQIARRRPGDHRRRRVVGQGVDGGERVARGQLQIDNQQHRRAEAADQLGCECSTARHQQATVEWLDRFEIQLDAGFVRIGGQDIR
jgi:hypothetical protein